MAPDYDAADAAPVNEQDASAYQDTQEDAPWKDITCTLKPRDLMGDLKEKTIRSGSLAANQDIKTYDAGNFYLATIDGTAVSWGKLWVEYDVTLITPQVPAGGFSPTGALVGATSLAAATPFGTAGVSTGRIRITASGLTVTLAGVDIGQELDVSCWIVGTNITDFIFSGSTGLTTKTALGATACINAAATTAMEMSTFIVTAANPTLTFTCAATTVSSSAVIAAVLTPQPSV